jgi:general secretion pathway protein K
MVLSIDADTYYWLEPLVTVYSQHSVVSLQVASKEVLQLLLGNTEQVARYVATRTESAKNNLPLPPLPSGAVSAESPETTILTVISEARLDEQTSAVVSVVLNKSLIGEATPFQVLNWQQNPHGTSLFADNMNNLVVKYYAESEFNH